jgi:hypothetical protein
MPPPDYAGGADDAAGAGDNGDGSMVGGLVSAPDDVDDFSG